MLALLHGLNRMKLLCLVVRAFLKLFFVYLVLENTGFIRYMNKDDRKNAE